MYKLYTKRLVGKDTFKAMTGIEVKAMPKPHKAGGEEEAEYDFSQQGLERDAPKRL